jgi:hypothetical protein
VGDYVKITEYAPTGASFGFTALGSYTHFDIRYSARGDTAATSVVMNLTFNGDTAGNYDRELVQGAASTASAVEGLAQTSAAVASVPGASATAAYAGAGIISVFDYRGVTFQKAGVVTETLRRSTASGNVFIHITGFGWRSAAAVTSVELALASGKFVDGSKFSLYGIN